MHFLEPRLGDPTLVSHNYVAVEAMTLVQRRLGSSALRTLIDDVIATLELLWVDERTRAAAVSALLAAGRRKVSPVDWVSFEVLRRHGIETAFAFDRVFAAQGFETVP